MISFLAGVLLAALHDLRKEIPVLSVDVPGYPGQDAEYDILIVTVAGKSYRITITEMVREVPR